MLLDHNIVATSYLLKGCKVKRVQLNNIRIDILHLCISPAHHDHVTGEWLYYKTYWQCACALGTRCVRQVVTVFCNLKQTEFYNNN